jgi:glutathione S-transferase
MSELRIFSYLPNPRIWKATIAARLNGVEVEVIGASPRELQSWLWDFDARPLTIHDSAQPGESTTGKVGFTGALRKTAAFLEAHPFGTVPAAFSPDGRIGIFESNSIMRAVARLGENRFPLYGRGPYEASRVDSFLDASLVLARDSQIYLLGLMSGSVSAETHARMGVSFAAFMAGIDQALNANREFLVGDQITLADICFVAELCLFHNERARLDLLRTSGLPAILDDSLAKEYPAAFEHLARLRKHAAFAPDVEPYLAKLGG